MDGVFSSNICSLGAGALLREAPFAMESEPGRNAILVVDDEPIYRELLRGVLASKRYDVLLAEDGEEGLELLKAHRPRLIIVDLYLPGMPGTEFIKCVRQDDQGSAVPIALYTASDITPALRDFMQLMKIRHVIPKPGESEQILATVRDALH